MGLFGLFGGGSPEDKAARAAEKAARHEARIHALLQRATGADPDHASRSARIQAAIDLILESETAKGREAYLSIARDFPDELSLCLEQVGVCYHLEKDYQSALDNYEAAIRAGADADALSDNMNEARKGLTGKA